MNMHYLPQKHNHFRPSCSSEGQLVLQLIFQSVIGLTLDMGYNILDGNLPEEIANFSFLGTLIEINMRQNKLSGKLPKDICGNTSPKLKRIYLTEYQLYGEIPGNIYKCRGLEDLRLAMNHFDGNIPREIWSLPMLRSLLLWSNHFKVTVRSRALPCSFDLILTVDYEVSVDLCYVACFV
ncbi:hypothetical protein ACS0TY_027177 [Phlomoides rotata]